MAHFTLVVVTDPKQHHHQPSVESLLESALKEIESSGHRVKHAYLLDEAGHHHPLKQELAT